MSCPDPLYDYADWLEEDEREYDEPESDEQRIGYDCCYS